jgi:hypothetical protein
MPQATNPLWINWIKTKARQILLEDLEPGGLLDGFGHLSEADVWHFYKERPEFKNVVFSQFEARLKDHRKQGNILREMATRDAKAVAHDRALYPRRPVNTRGEVKLDTHPAKNLLQEDVENKLHEAMDPRL